MSLHFPDPITLNAIPAIPANSQVAPIIDTTYLWNQAQWSSAASSAAPGLCRNMLAGRRVVGTVGSTGQAFTIKFEILTNPSGTTAAAFETDINAPGGGSFSIAASSTQPISWLPPTPDWRITATAGGTAPTTIPVSLIFTLDRNAGT